MQIQIVGKGIDLSEALRTHIEDHVTQAVEKYSNRPGEAYITVHKNNYNFEVNVSLHLSSGVMLQAHGEGTDAYTSCENCMTKLEKRLRRYKRKLKNHHNTQKYDLPAEKTFFYVIKSETDLNDPDDIDDAEEEKAPTIIAEHPGEIRTLTVSMAVQEMDLTDAPVLIFRNAAHGGLNIVMRRADGHIGWIDPDRVTRS